MSNIRSTCNPAFSHFVRSRPLCHFDKLTSTSCRWVSSFVRVGILITLYSKCMPSCLLLQKKTTVLASTEMLNGWWRKTPNLNTSRGCECGHGVITVMCGYARSRSQGVWWVVVMERTEYCERGNWRWSWSFRMINKIHTSPIDDASLAQRTCWCLSRSLIVLKMWNSRDRMGKTTQTCRKCEYRQGKVGKPTQPCRNAKIDGENHPTVSKC